MNQLTKPHERECRDQEVLPEVDVKGRVGLFTELRPHEVQAPDGLYTYALRHGDDGEPCTIERKVVVDYFGTIFVKEPFDFEGNDYIPLGIDDFGLTRKDKTFQEFQEK